MNLDVYNTHMELYPYVADDLPIIEALYTAIDDHTGEPFPCGYIIEDKKLYLPRGTPISRIESMADVTINFIDDDDESLEMSREYSPAFGARDQLQKDSISFLTTDDNKQLSLNLGTGKGKTFVTAYSIKLMQQRVLIITPDDGLKYQWIKTFKNMFDYTDSNILDISGSAIMARIVNDKIDLSDIDVMFVNHQTLGSYLRGNNGYSLHKFFKKIKIGIKVYDEAHLQFMNTLLIDFFSNTAKTFYLTATFDRSSKSQSKCFQLAYNSVSTFGEQESIAATEKHTIYIVINVNSRISPKDRANLIGYQGMTLYSYSRYAYKMDQNQTMFLAIKTILEKMKDVEGKTLIFIPTIEAIEAFLVWIRSQDIDIGSIGAYHSRMDEDDKTSNLQKDIIVSTIKSCGTGKDIPAMRTLILGEPFSSKITSKQVIGRLRPYLDSDGKILSTYLYDVVDRSITPIGWWHRARARILTELAKETKYLTITD